MRLPNSDTTKRVDGAANVMQIVPQRPEGQFVEHGKILRRLLAERAPEWQSRTGIRRIFARIQIELWAWRQARRELRRCHDKDEDQKIY